LRILFDHNVPVKVRRFLPGHEVRTVVEMNWPPQLENGELLTAAERTGFDVFVTSDQNIRFQQNLTARRLSLITLGSNIWNIVANYGKEIATAVDSATPGADSFISMPPATKRRIRRI
jgi:predicted nuclease of predicted toxin-antitoxin system